MERSLYEEQTAHHPLHGRQGKIPRRVKQVQRGVMEGILIRREICEG
jgi:hypothetical protein